MCDFCFFWARKEEIWVNPLPLVYICIYAEKHIRLLLYKLPLFPCLFSAGRPSNTIHGTSSSPGLKGLGHYVLWQGDGHHQKPDGAGALSEMHPAQESKALQPGIFPVSQFYTK